MSFDKPEIGYKWAILIGKRKGKRGNAKTWTRLKNIFSYVRKGQPAHKIWAITNPTRDLIKEFRETQRETQRSGFVD